MATGTALQRRVYTGGASRTISVYPRKEVETLAVVSAPAYFTYAILPPDLVSVGSYIEVIGPDYVAILQITADACNAWDVAVISTADGGVGVMPDDALQIAKVKAQSPNVGSAVAIDQVVVGVDGKLYQNTSGVETTMPAAFPDSEFEPYYATETRLTDVVSANLAFRRALQIELPFITQTILDMETANGATTPGDDPLIYVQSWDVDEESNEVFLLHAGGPAGNIRNYIAVYDFTTGVEKTTFFISLNAWRESIIYRKVGNIRYLYGLQQDNVFRVDISSLPANGSTIVPSGADIITPAIPTFTQLLSLGKNWAYMRGDTNNAGGIRVKHRWVIADEDFNFLGEVVFPIGVMGSFEEYTNDFVKTQGVCFHKGDYIIGVGGSYFPQGAGAVSDAALMQNKQGIIICTPTGDTRSVALCEPDDAISFTSELLGRDVLLHENEGVVSSGGSLFALWQVLSPDEWRSSEALQRGVVITRELDTSADAVDYSGGAAIIDVPFDQRQQSALGVSITSLKSPASGQDLTSFDDVIDMMIGLDRSYYSFYGTNQTMVDTQGATVNVSGAFVEFTLAGGAVCQVSIKTYPSKTTTYWVFDINQATRNQLPVTVELAAPINGSNANGNYTKWPDGTMICTHKIQVPNLSEGVGSMFRSPSTLWTFPDAFIADAILSGVGGGSNFWVAGVSSPLTSTFRVMSPVSIGTPVTAELTAVGRWK